VTREVGRSRGLTQLQPPSAKPRSPQPQPQAVHQHHPGPHTHTHPRAQASVQPHPQAVRRGQAQPASLTRTPFRYRDTTLKRAPRTGHSFTLCSSVSACVARVRREALTLTLDALAAQRPPHRPVRATHPPSPHRPQASLPVHRKTHHHLQPHVEQRHLLAGEAARA
jgi:hypothetical protein